MEENLSNPIIIEKDNPNKLPQALNILTILTLIGSAIALFSGILSYFTVCGSAKQLESMDLDDAELGGFLSKFLEGAGDLIQKQCELRLPVFIVTIVGTLLCIFGALQMRKLKKQGFHLYVVGELIVPIATLALLGFGTMSGVGLTGLLIPGIFIALYATQLKHLR
jgi:hypothetical protein